MHQNDHSDTADLVGHNAHEDHTDRNAYGQHGCPVGVGDGVKTDGASEECAVIEAECNAGERGYREADPQQPVARGLASGSEIQTALTALFFLLCCDCSCDLFGFLIAVCLGADLLRVILDH